MDRAHVSHRARLIMEVVGLGPTTEDGGGRRAGPNAVLVAPSSFPHCSVQQSRPAVVVVVLGGCRRMGHSAGVVVHHAPGAVLAYEDVGGDELDIGNVLGAD